MTILMFKLMKHEAINQVFLWKCFSPIGKLKEKHMNLAITFKEF